MPIGMNKVSRSSKKPIVIPDAVKAQFDPKQDSVATSISTIADQLPDRVADFTLSAGSGWSVISDGINGYQSFRSDGSSRATQDTTITTSDPFAAVFVCQQQEPVDSNSGYFDGGSDQEFVLQDNNGTPTTRGYRSGNPNVGSSTKVDQTPRVWVVEAFGDDKIRAERDGTELFNGTATASDLTGFTLGGFRSAVSPIQMDYGRFEILTGYTDTVLNNRRDDIAADYDITI